MSFINIPNIGDGITQGIVVSILVSVGDEVAVEDTLLELETDKAVAPVPAPAAGKIKEILVKEGEQVQVGQKIIVLEGGASEAPSFQTTPASPKPVEAPKNQPAPAPVTPPAPMATPGTLSTSYQYQSPTGTPPPAAPSVRKIADDLGIDLYRVQGSERGGRITLADLRLYIQQLQSLSQTPVAPAQEAPKQKVSIDFSKWGAVRTEKVSSLRQLIGERMSQSWNEIPHVTQFAKADITHLLSLRKKLVPQFKKQGVKLTVTALMIKAVVKVLKEFSLFNASLDQTKQEIVYKDYYHLGIAVDTEAGLIVPVLRDADKLSLKEVSLKLDELAQKTRDRKVTVEDLQGASFTISNLGGVGGSYFTPIINAPEVAILAVGQATAEPIYSPDGKKIVKGMMMPVGVSYDHRVIDGADAARFIKRFVTILEDLSEKDLNL